VIDGSPAQSAGLHSHDAIYTIDGEHVRAEEGLAVVDRIRGPEGSDVVLEVASPGELRREVVVTRGRLTAIDRFYTGKFPSGASYILSPVMADRTLSDAIVEDLHDLEEQAQTPGIILDLRIAHATAEWPLISLLALFSDGNHGAFYGREEQTPLTVAGQDLYSSQSIPLVILIGPDTNGPSEVFAAALQANGRATLVGLPTPGKILGFEVRRLSDGSQLTYAASSFNTSDGQDLAWSGISPDVLVNDDWDQVSTEFDPVVETAVQILLSNEDLDD
jgi:carboxyl-terminal processing protease